ncbi:GTP 3',8-cyclase MoaA [Desulfurivibrio dismutans]|uniref:GTP 3',8-cyclase MoaA n=1 Tax=Desulfurivibrio dismutans TaxID=1398908 RepID=UPI0023DBA246|nr:GTP 3',8-cyclase MoaA [Desulfurivibrio alkaliphilus]MDF1615467.1 GTP 3',8-cyclase MoaA [Desulfurivibrio alkaliphilus]
MTPHHTPAPPAPTLTDNLGRTINYVRLAVTDRCNLNCRYCRPKGPCDEPRRELLSYEELERLTRLLVEMGVSKVRITGGEPLVRHGMLDFMRRLQAIDGLHQLALTTNATLLGPRLADLRALNLAGLNISLDTLRPERFAAITGQNLFADVFAVIEEAIFTGIPVKINAVVQEGINTDELLDLARLAADRPIQVRFIEPMPFDGGNSFVAGNWNLARLEQHFREHLPDVREAPTAGATARVLQAAGFKGSIGLIGGYSRCFCATCNKIRITPQGMLKTCLYDDGVLDLKEVLRSGSSDRELAEMIRACLGRRHADGFAAAEQRKKKGLPGSCASMATIGG